MSHPLMREDESYTRYMDVIEGYIDTHSRTLSLQTGICIEEARSFIEGEVNDHAIKDVAMRVLRRDKNGDRVKDTVGLLQYLNWVDKNGHILAPNMVSYAHPDKKLSYTAVFVRQTLAERSAIKKSGQRAKQLSNTAATEAEKRELLEQAYFDNLEQGNKKFFNNSLSGAGLSEHNPLFYASKHSGLTGTCRSCTATANLINEKLHASNRHYYDFDVTVQNIGYVLNNSDSDLIRDVAEKYNMEIPTAQNVKDIIFDSTKEYWRSDRKYKIIEGIVDNMTPMERLEFAYIGDLNAICKYSDATVRTMFNRLMDRSKYTTYTEDIFKLAHEDMLILAVMLCNDFMKGMSPSDVKKADPDKYQILCNTLGTVIKTMSEYSDFLRAFIITNVMPQNIFNAPSMIRKAVPAGDTDSSIYTVAGLVKWYNKGTIDWSPESVSVSNIGVFFSSSMISHGMFKLSRQLGVSEEEKFRIAMKGEFFMSVLLISNLTKHYAYLADACEGKIAPVPEMSAMGVQLKSSKLPMEIRNKSWEWYEKVMLAISSNAQITPNTIKSYPAYLEHIVMESVRSGDTTFLSKETVKDPTNYKNPSSSPWIYIDMWNSSFADKYGPVTELPVVSKKIPVKLAKPIHVTEWCDSLEPSLGNNIKDWCGKSGKKTFGHILLPQMNLPGGKLPKEVMDIIDLRELVSGLINHAYIFMTMLGIQVKDSAYTRLCSDSISKERAIEEIKKLGLEPFDNY